jgi:hypothetical protein
MSAIGRAQHCAMAQRAGSSAKRRITPNSGHSI